MIYFSYEQLNALLTSFFWPLVRVLALFSADPVLGNRAVPMRVRILLALLLTWLIVPVLPAFPKVELLSASGISILLQQILVGVAIGFAMRITFAGFELAGQIVGLQMGLGFATLFDPQNSTQIPVVGQLISIVTTLIYFALDAHLLTISAMVESFSIFPIQLLDHVSMDWSNLLRWAGRIFLWGMVLSLPLVTTLLVTNIALGVLARAAPQLNIFSVGFPVTLMVGFLILYATLPTMIDLLRSAIEQTVHVLMHELLLV